MLEKKQIQEWAENPVTIELATYIASELVMNTEAKSECYHPFEPQRTQEIHANLNGCEESLESFLAYLEGYWDFNEDEEDDGEAVLE